MFKMGLGHLFPSLPHKQTLTSSPSRCFFFFFSLIVRPTPSSSLLGYIITILHHSHFWPHYKHFRPSQNHYFFFSLSSFLPL